MSQALSKKINLNFLISKLLFLIRILVF